MTCREILTLQFGHYSNFVGAHWWNAQELSFDYNASKPSEIDHDVLFREGLTPKGEITFTPRVLLIDLKGSLKSLSKQGGLYEQEVPDELDPLWSEPAEIHAEPTINKNAFQEAIESTSKTCNQKLDTAVIQNLEIDVWSDFLYTRFHPRSVNIVNEFEHNDVESDFGSFPLGYNIWESAGYQEEMANKIRMYIEECDNFQGFHMLMDSTNAFSGLASACTEHLNDEYDTKPIFALPLIPGYYSDYKWDAENDKHKSGIMDSLRVLNLAFSFHSLGEEAKLFTPLCVGETGFRKPGTPISFNHLDYSIESLYHTSAILASAIDTFSLIYRAKSTNHGLCDLAVDLTPYGRKAVASSLCLPFSFNQGADLIDCLDNWDGPLAHSITPRCKIGKSQLTQLVALRGIPESCLKKPLPQAGKQRDLPAYKCNTIEEMLTMYYEYTCDASQTNVTSIEKGFSVKPPFPQLFKPEIGVEGKIMYNKRLENICVESVPVLAGLHNGTEMGVMLENLHSEARKIRLSKFHQFTLTGYGKDEFEECLEKLCTLQECYENSYLV